MPSVQEQDEWLWGWDTTPGIVSVWADDAGHATVWRRIPTTGVLVREDETFRAWMLLDSLEDLMHLGPQLARENEEANRDVEPNDNRNNSRNGDFRYRELSGAGTLRFLVSANTSRQLTNAVLRGAEQRLGQRPRSVRDLGEEHVLHLPPEEQYLVSTGRTYFRDLAFDQLHRMQFDLETTGLEPQLHRIFMIAVRFPDGTSTVLEARDDSDRSEAQLIRELVDCVRRADPDVIENHNLHGFDLPFLERRAAKLGVALALGRIGGAGMRQRAARRGARSESDARRRVRFIIPGRELIDTLDAVRRYDFSARDLPGHGLKVVARHLGLSAPDREYVRGDQIYTVFKQNPERVRRYATGDVDEVEGLARVMGGAAFALARMAPRRYERLADAGAATGVIDPLLVRAYLRAGMALPAHKEGDGTTHTGAALHLFATGVAQRVVKADVASLYPSLMRAFRIGPKRDHLGAMLALVDRLVDTRLTAKANARLHPAGSTERYTLEATSAAMKLVINSAYGYLAAGGGLTRFADVHAANEVTRRGRETLALMCHELAKRGVTLLEADTDGVYFAVPDDWTETDERRVVSEVATLLPPLVQLEFEGRYAAMLSHEPKNYALLRYDGTLILRGVAFRSSRAEPFGDTFLRRAIGCALRNDVAGVRLAYLDTIRALRAHELTVFDVSSRVRMTKSAPEYLKSREKRRELQYEAMLSSGRETWRVGDKVRVYRTDLGRGGVVSEVDDDSEGIDDRRNYDVEHYERVLRDAFATRLARAFTPEGFEIVFAEPDQFPLFGEELDRAAIVLNTDLE